MHIYSGDNPAQLYLDALKDIQENGEELAPRGKKVLEIRPATFKYTNPLNRAVFLKGRKMNPFFLMAEALWIVAGRADVEWLTKFNKNMAQFSDDGVSFNAPYGQRLRRWNTNDVQEFIFNPIDQLYDVYQKLLTDEDTRQAVAVIYNPLFDNGTIDTLDTPCNLILTFKLRKGKLELTVYNRSNDIHYGVFTNLVQFSTIQELVASWLNVEVGAYHQVTDSLHNYLEDFGAKETDKILSNFEESSEVEEFTFDDEPRMSLGFNELDHFLTKYFNFIDPYLMNDEYVADVEVCRRMLEPLDGLDDRYWADTLYAMLAYRCHKVGNKQMVFEALDKMCNGQWKMSCLYFLYNKYSDEEEFTNLYADYDERKKAFIEGRD